MELNDQIPEAEQRVRPHVRETWLERIPWLDREGARAYCKPENFQHTGSFKVRGAISKLLSMTSWELTQGVVTASTGNHGLGIALGLRRTKARGLVRVPNGTASERISAIER